MPTDNFVTLITFPYAHQLGIVRSKLESEGIESVVQDELTIQTDPLYSNALGGVKLKVRESKLLQAIEILKEAGHGDLLETAEPDENIFVSGIERANEKLKGWFWVAVAAAVVLLAAALYWLVQ